VKRLFCFVLLAGFLLAVVLLEPQAARAQVTRILIPAGTPEDKALQDIAAETDAGKRITMLQDFLKQYTTNPQIVAYGEWQLSQSYADQGDAAKAIEHGQKAADLQPGNLDILISLATIAQKAKAADTVMDCVVKGGTAFNGIAKKPKPDGMDPEDFKLRVQQEQEPFRQSYEYLEVTGLNTMVAEEKPQKRMSYLERYIVAFPDSRFQDQVMQLAVYSLGQMNDSARLLAFGDKALAANPKSVSMLTVIANAYSENADLAFAARAEAYARQALVLCNSQVATDENKLAFYAAMAHSALGYALLRQEKNLPAIAELKVASNDLKSTPDAYATAMYRLGFAYAKTGKLSEAKATLTEVAGIAGPYQQPAKELLAKVDAAAKKAPPKKK
jgi:tetratricopeptide (TPR) repeat protein